MIRAVLDVNVIISAVITENGPPHYLLGAWRDGAFSLVISIGIISEVLEKLYSPRIGGIYGITDESIRELVALLQTQSDLIGVSATDVIPVTGDPEDDYVLATCVVSRADFLVTGDKRLLALGEHEGMRIVTPTEFVREYLQA
jgi:putative PIN family toxin of toxin-antitoxin system